MAQNHLQQQIYTDIKSCGRKLFQWVKNSYELFETEQLSYGTVSDYVATADKY